MRSDKSLRWYLKFVSYSIISEPVMSDRVERMCDRKFSCILRVCVKMNRMACVCVVCKRQFHNVVCCDTSVFQTKYNIILLKLYLTAKRQCDKSAKLFYFYTNWLLSVLWPSFCTEICLLWSILSCPSILYFIWYVVVVAIFRLIQLKILAEIRIFSRLRKLYHDYVAYLQPYGYRT